MFSSATRPARALTGRSGEGWWQMSNKAVRAQWSDRFGRPEPKIVCVGLNYRAHADESGIEPPRAPILFGKFANTLLGDGDAIVLPPGIGHVDSEAELAVVIGERASRVSEDEAMGVIAAYTCANDVSARDAQLSDGQWFGCRPLPRSQGADARRRRGRGRGRGVWECCETRCGQIRRPMKIAFTEPAGPADG